MSNERDCEHGRQHGKCETCELQEERGDNARLRALIKAAEMAATDRDRCAECPWCEMGKPHAVDCPAFTPDGSAR